MFAQPVRPKDFANRREPIPPIIHSERARDRGMPSLRHEANQSPTTKDEAPMKTATALSAAGLFSFMIAGITPAAAFHLTPENSNFTGKGWTSATKNGVSLKCKAKFKGNVDSSGIGHVTSGTFSGQVGCSTVTLSNLPWKGTAVAKATTELDDVTFSSPIGDCGPGNIDVKLIDGVIKFTAVPLTGGCTVSGKITTTPTLAIAR